MSRAPQATVLLPADATSGAGEEPADPEPRSPPLLLSFDLIESAGNWEALGDIETIVAAAVGAVARAPQLAHVLPQGALAVAVVLSDDREVAGYNGQYRGMPKPTNVLSFPAAPDQPVPDGEMRSLGDIILAVETIGREAAEQGVPFAHHLQHLVVHGLLHLAGFDHIEAADAETMEALETAILATIGVPDPYAGSEPVAPSAKAQQGP